jgi:nucleoside-diphosphate-sugar epimerase
VYDTFEDGIAKTEESPINLGNLSFEYAFLKYVSEVNLPQKHRHGFCPVTILRFGIVYGPRKENWSPVEVLLNTVATKDEIEVGALATGRNFIHVSDIASGILASVGLPNFQIISLQGEKPMTLGEVLEMSQDFLDTKILVRGSNAGSPSIPIFNNSKAGKTMDWSPKITL